MEAEKAVKQVVFSYGTARQTPIGKPEASTRRNRWANAARCFSLYNRPHFGACAPEPSLNNLRHLTPGFGLLLGERHPGGLVLG